MVPFRAKPPSPPVRPQPAKVEPAEAKRDQIAAMIRNDAPPEYSERLAAAQKALLRAGFVLRSDGMMGAGTRKAIEQFQHDRGLTVTGELNDRTLRELRTLPGVVIP
jgi:peptidoglycan hydrolase-like protein with peptidoglycan-binding domain